VVRLEASVAGVLVAAVPVVVGKYFNMRFQRKLFLPFCLLFAQIINAQDSILNAVPNDSLFIQADTNSIKDDNSTAITLLFAGDIMGHDTQIEGAFIDSIKGYNYEPTFRYITDYFQSADLVVGNLEVTLAGPPYKGYPQFSSPDELAVAAKAAGIDVMVTANNHALDRGSKGMIRTMNMLDSFNFAHAGIYRSDEDRTLRYPLILEVKGARLALLNYTYGTNGLKVQPPLIVNRIDTAQIRKDVAKAKLAEPDYIICAIHWGKEYERTENIKQKKLARFMLNQGVDAIIGSHPHVVQPVKLLDCSPDDSTKNCPVVYSMGNFVSNQRAQYKDGGIIAELHLSKDSLGVAFDSISYLPYWVYREKRSDEKYTFYVVPVARYESNSEILDLNDNDLWKFNRFKNDTRTHLKDVRESVYYSE
jgi:poly-gamma-glutamate synthesis protein (capsule biosynthesis protein)